MYRQFNKRGYSFFLATIASLMLVGLFSACVPKGVSVTKEIVEQVLKRSWDKSGAEYPNVKVSLTLNDVKFGTAYVATVQEVQVEGFPEGATVTPAIVDFTVRTYYDKETQAVRRVREARVYKDKFDEWAVMTGSVRGEDTTTIEAPKK